MSASVFLQRRKAKDLHVLLAHADQPRPVKAREEPAHRFDPEAQIARDLAALHAQVELPFGQAAGAHALRHVDEEGREPFVGAHRPQEHHHAVLAHQLAAHRLLEPAHDGLVEPREVDGMDTAVLERDHLGGVESVGHAVETHDFAGHVEAGDLDAAILQESRVPEAAAEHDVDRFERIIRAVKRVAATHEPRSPGLRVRGRFVPARAVQRGARDAVLRRKAQDARVRHRG